MPAQHIPDYLKTYIVKQDPSLYTPMDHASWRYILKISRVFFAKHAQKKYVDGLRETGISTERIPLIEEMDRCLQKFNWSAVAVSGFIPPAVFMEFLSRGVLPIACDMRKIENLAYTPAPDIVHEAAGHAPIIADPEYARYLRHYGELAEKAIYSQQDLDVYEAVRLLSDTKEDPSSTPEQIAAAQRQLDRAVAAVDHDTEATQLGRMGWWTIEYGLLGDPSDPKIYGAGLLSSVGESFHCLNPEVAKIPFSVECVNQSYDITRPQPQLFIAPDFEALKRGIDEFAARMAYRRGGVEGLEKALKARVPTTSVLESGIQISGTLSGFDKDAQGQPCYLKFKGPTQLSRANREVPGQGAGYHAQGFGTPVGKLRGLAKSPAELSGRELEAMGFTHGAKGRMEFESGVVIEGILTGKHEHEGRNLILTFQDCTVRRGAESLFQPDWGAFDMACGSHVTSVFGGAADRERYLEATGGFLQAPGKPKTNLTPGNRALNELYARVRKIRDAGRPSADAVHELSQIHDSLEREHREDWLLRYELLELDAAHHLQSPWASLARSRLMEIAKSSRQLGETIGRGMELLT